MLACCLGRAGGPCALERDLDECPDVFGPASCRRLSLSDLDPQRRAPSGGGGGGGSTSGGAGASGSAGARASLAAAAGVSLTASSGSAAAGGGLGPPQHSKSCTAAPGRRPAPDDSFIEYNPLRRMSLPLAGLESRPADVVRRASLTFGAPAGAVQGARPAAIAARG